MQGRGRPWAHARLAWCRKERGPLFTDRGGQPGEFRYAASQRHTEPGLRHEFQSPGWRSRAVPSQPIAWPGDPGQVPSSLWALLPSFVSWVYTLLLKVWSMHQQQQRRPRAYKTRKTLCPDLLYLNLCLKILGDRCAPQGSRSIRSIAHPPPPGPGLFYGSKAITDLKHH